MSATMPASPSADPERPLPSNFEAERSVLGAILLAGVGNENNALEVAHGIVTERDFFGEGHREIFHAMVELSGSLTPIELVTVTEFLAQERKLARVPGGAGYISGLLDCRPRIANVEHYARIVKEKALLRSLIKTTNEIQQQAFEAEDDADRVLELARESISKLEPSGKPVGEPARWADEFHTFAEFESAQSLSFSIKGFLQNDGATMIGGLSGHGKTLALLSITRALLAGKGARLWDLFEVEENALRVIYLIPECSIQPFKHRLQTFGLYDYLQPGDNRLLVRTLSKGPAPRLSNPRILFAAKGAHVILDTAARFSDGDENSAGDNMRGLATDIFALLSSGARSVIAAHHSPKPFARENVMRLENVLRGSGDIGAMLTTAWGIKQLDAAQNIIHVENIKPRDFQPCQPFQIIGRPFIDETGDFALHKKPGECGALQDEQEPERDHGGGAPQAIRDARAANLALMRGWLSENPGISSRDLARRFSDIGVKVGDSAIRRYRKDLSL